MLYRQFPKIANVHLSILGLSVAGLNDSSRTADFLAGAAEFGINFIASGPDPAHILRISEILELTNETKDFFRFYQFSGNSGAELEAFLGTVQSTERDFLMIHLNSAEYFHEAEKSGILEKAAKARASGKIGGCGFSSGADSLLIQQALDSHDGWDFFSAPFNFLRPDISGEIAYAARRSVGFIASDPFAGGLLENPGAAVHRLYENAPVLRSYSEWALRSIWENQAVVGIMYEPTTKDLLIRNAIFAEAGRPNSLPEKELSVLDNAKKTLDRIDQIQQS